MILSKWDSFSTGDMRSLMNRSELRTLVPEGSVGTLSSSIKFLIEFWRRAITLPLADLSWKLRDAEYLIGRCVMFAWSAMPATLHFATWYLLHRSALWNKKNQKKLHKPWRTEKWGCNYYLTASKSGVNSLFEASRTLASCVAILVWRDYSPRSPALGLKIEKSKEFCGHADNRSIFGKQLFRLNPLNLGKIFNFFALIRIWFF